MQSVTTNMLTNHSIVQQSHNGCFMFTCLAWKGSVNFKGEIHWSDIYTVHTHVFTIGSRNLDLEIWIWRFGFGDLDFGLDCSGYFGILDKYSGQVSD